MNMPSAANGSSLAVATAEEDIERSILFWAVCLYFFSLMLFFRTDESRMKIFTLLVFFLLSSAIFLQSKPMGSVVKQFYYCDFFENFRMAIRGLEKLRFFATFSIG